MRSKTRRLRGRFHMHLSYSTVDVTLTPISPSVTNVGAFYTVVDINAY